MEHLIFLNLRTVSLMYFRLGKIKLDHVVTHFS